MNHDTLVSNMINSRFLTLIVLILFVIGGVAAYAGATNTLSFGEDNSTIVENSTENATAFVGVTNTTDPGTTVINNNYVNVDNNINVPISVQPSITPTQTTTDDTLQKATIVTEKTVMTPKVIQQKTVVIKTSDLYTGQLIKLSDKEQEKLGLEITEVNTGKTGCEYIVIKNNNDFDMGLGGYTLYIAETETGIRLPNIEVAAGKTVKMFTVNGKPDTFDKDSNLDKFHFRLAKELYPDDTEVSIYLLEPNFNEAISEITTEA
jgi:hypothetical protein